MNKYSEDLEKEIQTRLEFLSTAKCNHTPHMYIDIAGGLIEGTLLSRILYWFSTSKNGRSKVRIYKNGHYWLAKRRTDWMEEIRITERQYDRAIKKLRDSGFIELAKYKFDSMPTVHIRPVWENINKATDMWKANLREEIIKEYEIDRGNGNNTKCNSQGNDTKCNSRVTKEVIPLTLPTYIAYKDNINYSNKDFTKDFSKGEKTLPDGKGVKTSASNNNNINSINNIINNIPPRTKEQKKVRYTQIKNSSSLDYKDEELPQLIYDKFNAEYGDKENILEDHDICLTMSLIAHFFKKFKESKNERHPMISQDDAVRFLRAVSSPNSRMARDGMVEEENELEYYLTMMDEYFNTDIGTRNGMSCDYHIWLFFDESTQNILYERVKEKGEY